MISEETVTHVARLARLTLTPEEIQAYTQDLGKILHLVDELSELDLSQADVTLQAEEPTLFRADDTTWTYDRDVLMTNAPQEENGFFRVPRIMDEGGNG